MTRRHECPLCGGASGLETAAWGRRFYRCGTCDLVFVPRGQHLPREKERAQYELHENTIDNIGYVRMFTRKIRILRKVWRDVHRVLDYGCGPGPVLVELLRRMGYDAVGYDPFFAPHPQVLRTPYDAVVSTETFEHFASPASELERIDRLLHAGGFLAIMTQFRRRDRPLGAWWYIREATHVAFYSSHTFDWIGRAFGWEIVYRNDRDFVIYRKPGL